MAIRPHDWLNLPRALCQYCLGHDHAPSHRMFMGMLVMAAGVTVVKAGGDIHVYYIHYLADGIGYAIHGMGALPFIEWLIGDRE